MNNISLRENVGGKCGNYAQLENTPMQIFQIANNYVAYCRTREELQTVNVKIMNFVWIWQTKILQSENRLLNLDD